MNPTEQRMRMVARQLAGRDITDARVLAAFRAVPREQFVPDELLECAYEDTPLPIDGGQTLSQPFIVALSVQALGLTGDERVLEVGTGSGYAAAILGLVAREVYTIERLAPLAASARERLQRLGYHNIHILHGDGTLGCPEHAPYDAIVVAAGGPEVPQSLLDQLAPGGRLVMPVGPEEHSQMLVKMTREDGAGLRTCALCAVRFVPLIGEEGWSEAAPEHQRKVVARAPARPVTASAPGLLRPGRARPRGSRRRRGQSPRRCS